MIERSESVAVFSDDRTDRGDEFVAQDSVALRDKTNGGLAIKRQTAAVDLQNVQTSRSKHYACYSAARALFRPAPHRGGSPLSHRLGLGCHLH